MAEARRPGGKNLIAALVILTPIIGFVVWSSFQVNAVECEVCLRFDGRDMCRTASAATQNEALRSATDNACALLTSGMTNTIRCHNVDPVKTECRAAGG